MNQSLFKCVLVSTGLSIFLVFLRLFYAFYNISHTILTLHVHLTLLTLLTFTSNAFSYFVITTSQLLLLKKLLGLIFYMVCLPLYHGPKSQVVTSA